MVMDLLKKNNRYVMLILILAIAYLSYLIIKPFISAILASLIIAYIFYPAYKKVFGYTKNKTVSSLIITILILLIILIPIIFLLKVIATQAYNFYYKGNLADLITKIEGYVGDSEIYSYALDTLNSLTSYVIKILSGFVLSFPKMVLDFFVILFTVFYLFKDWESLYEQIKKVIFIKEREKIVNHIKYTTNAIVYGFFTVAVLEGILTAIGLLIFGIPNAFFLGLITIILAILPFVGASLIWIPAAIWLLYKGKLIMGIFFVLYCTIFISGTEYLVRPKLIGDKAKIHPAIILLGILGGLALLGFIGIVIGPLILSILYVLIRDIIKK